MSSFDDPFDPIRKMAHQIAALDWFSQRTLFRRLNHQRVRLEEGLPELDAQGRYVDGDETKGIVTGRAKGPSIREVEEFWGSDTIPAFALATGDGRVGEELDDLSRDAMGLARSEGVRFDRAESEVERSFTPELPDVGNEGQLDDALQRHLERWER